MPSHIRLSAPEEDGEYIDSPDPALNLYGRTYRVPSTCSSISSTPGFTENSSDLQTDISSPSLPPISDKPEDTISMMSGGHRRREDPRRGRPDNPMSPEELQRMTADHMERAEREAYQRERAQQARDANGMSFTYTGRPSKRTKGVPVHDCPHPGCKQGYTRLEHARRHHEARHPDCQEMHYELRLRPRRGSGTSQGPSERSESASSPSDIVPPTLSSDEEFRTRPVATSSRQHHSGLYGYSNYSTNPGPAYGFNLHSDPQLSQGSHYAGYNTQPHGGVSQYNPYGTVNASQPIYSYPPASMPMGPRYAPDPAGQQQQFNSVHDSPVYGQSTGSQHDSPAYSTAFSSQPGPPYHQG